MTDRILDPSNPGYDEHTEELKALRAYRDQREREYAEGPDKVRADDRARERALRNGPKSLTGHPARPQGAKRKNNARLIRNA